MPFTYVPHPVDQLGIADRIERIKSRSIKAESKVQGLLAVLSMIDLTTLEGADTPNKVRQVCAKAIRPQASVPEWPSVAAVCVYPSMVATAAQCLRGSGVKVAAVSTYFPSGQATLEAKIIETQNALKAGADEIDMVISRSAFLQGRHDDVLAEIEAVLAVCKAGNARLKVILETGELGSLDEVRLAADIALQANPDFIKTSTGKISQAATMPVTLTMLYAIHDHYKRTGVQVGMKPAGGIADAKTALHYLMMVHEVLGPEWLSPQWFRFGASRLANDVLMQLEKQRSGRYQGADYFSKD